MHSRFNKPALIMVLLYVFVTFAAAGGNDLVRSPGTRLFKLTLLRKTKELERGRQVVSGSIRVHEMKENSLRVDLAVKKINREYEPQAVAKIAPPIAPFHATATIGNIPTRLELRMTAAADEAKTDRNLLSNQYRLAYLILDMLMLNRGLLPTRQLRFSETGIFIKIPELEKVKVGKFGVISSKELKTCIAPATFSVVPAIGAGDPVTHLHAVKEIGARVELFTRTLDSDSLFVTSAVSMVAAAPKAKRQDLTIQQLHKTLEDIENYSDYERHEITTYVPSDSAKKP